MFCRFLPPANEVCERYVFTGVCLSTGGGVRDCSGGHAWLLWGGMHGCSGGGCMVALGGHAWLLRGHVVTPRGHAWLLQGACMVALGEGVCGYSGVCVVALGGMHGYSGGGAHGIRRDTEIRSMNGWYASYWNAFLFFKKIVTLSLKNFKVFSCCKKNRVVYTNGIPVE